MLAIRCYCKLFNNSHQSVLSALIHVRMDRQSLCILRGSINVNFVFPSYIIFAENTQTKDDEKQDKTVHHQFQSNEIEFATQMLTDQELKVHEIISFHFV